jgi:two-component system response regulator TtrR
MGPELVKMAKFTEQHVFFVDDEPKVHKVVAKTLKRAGFKVSCFSSAADCLEQLNSRPCDLLITDVKMPGMDGIELLTIARCIIPSLPVLVVTGYGDIQMAVTALKSGASDFIEKPLKRESFLSAVKLALKPNPHPHPVLNKSLTRSEMRILCMILDGKSNRQIAHLLSRSVRTVEVHRRHIMRKLGVDNIVRLVKRAVAMGLVEVPAGKDNLL